MKDEEYDQAADFWHQQDADSKHMKEDDLRKAIEDFLKSHKIIALGTSGENVRVTPVEYNYFDGALYIFSEGGEKFANLKNNKNVGGAIFDQDGSFGKLNSVQIQGTAEMIEPFSNEYNRAAADRNIPLEVLKKLEHPMWLIKIIPEEIIYLNSKLRKQGYDPRQILINHND